MFQKLKNTKTEGKCSKKLKILKAVKRNVLKTITKFWKMYMQILKKKRKILK